MKVFSKDKFIEVEGQEKYQKIYEICGGDNWINECDGKTIEECKQLGYQVSNDWLIEVEDRKNETDTAKEDLIKIAKSLKEWCLKYDKQFIDIAFVKGDLMIMPQLDSEDNARFRYFEQREG